MSVERGRVSRAPAAILNVSVCVFAAFEAAANDVDNRSASAEERPSASCGQVMIFMRNVYALERLSRPARWVIAGAVCHALFACPVQAETFSTDDVATLPHDLAPWGMFLHADVIVKAVMVGLVVASLFTWTVFIAKNVELWLAKRRARRDLAVLNKCHTLLEVRARLQGSLDPVALLVTAAANELQSSSRSDPAAVKERISWMLERIQVAAYRHIGRGMGLVASIGATAPFVGLFGTVWGIMNSFIGISNAHTTNLAVVAPGIAEALLATALGLIAAIPAVVIYNAFSRSVAGYRQLLGDATVLVMRLVSREYEEAAVAHSRAAE